MLVKLYLDDEGVTHWRYVMAGVLTMCGDLDSGALVGPHREAAAPVTCLRCLVEKIVYDTENPGPRLPL